MWGAADAKKRCSIPSGPQTGLGCMEGRNSWRVQLWADGSLAVNQIGYPNVRGPAASTVEACSLLPWLDDKEVDEQAEQ